MKPQSQAGYLGVDFGDGARRAGQARAEREAQGQDAHRELAGFARAARRCSVACKLARARAHAAQLHGHELHGVFGAAMTGARR
eukprot:2488620-Pyramimonas_sp.AAC.1